jgi:hypothetical protein
LKESPKKKKTVKGSITCSNSAFGGDPLPGYYKHCFCNPATKVTFGDSADYTCEAASQLTSLLLQLRLHSPFHVRQMVTMPLCQILVSA